MIGDEQLGELEGDLAGSFKQRDAGIAYEHKRLQEHNAQIRSELQQLQSQPSPLHQLQSRKQDFLSDLQKFKDLISNLSMHTSKLQARRDQGILEKRTAEARLLTCQQEQMRLQVPIVLMLIFSYLVGFKHTLTHLYILYLSI